MEPANTGPRSGGTSTATPPPPLSSSHAQTRPAGSTERPRSRPGPPRSSATGRVSPSAAVIARPLLVVLPVVTFLLPALLIAFTRTPTYSAEARLLVGGWDVQAQAVPGFVEAAQTLAETYSRLVATPAIEEPAAQALGTGIGAVDGGIHGTAVPESSLIRVIGEADSRQEAIRLADAAAEALIDYAGGGAGGSDVDDALAEYQEASRALASAQSEASAAQANVDAVEAGTAEQVTTARAALADARAAVSAAELRQAALGERYTQAASGGDGTTLDLVSPATEAGSDRRAAIQLAIAGPLLLGLVVGTALATLVVNRQADRELQRGNRTVADLT